MGTPAGGPRVVIVTGASSGIGQATARAAATAGDHLALVARDDDLLSQVAAEAAGLGAASVATYPLDVRDTDAVDAAVSAVRKRHGRVDLAVANAGVVAYGRFEDVPPEVFEGVLRTSVVGSANLARAVLPAMRRRGSGSVVLVGSVIGHLVVPDMSAYVVAKWGVRALARQLELECRDAPGVTVGYVAPGGVDTPIYQQAAHYGEVAGRPPFPATTPEKVAARILDIASGDRSRSQVGLANDMMRFGFTAFPWVYDAVVGPLFGVIAQDRTTKADAGPGNVLDARPERNALHGGHGPSLVAIARNLRTLLPGPGWWPGWWPG